MDSPNATCRYCGKVGKIKYYYLGLCDKIERWCSDAAMCSKMMAHWENKGHWIYGCGPNQELKEIWDGSRFNELKWFWDPQAQWMLPSKCPFCETIFSVEEIKVSREEDVFFPSIALSVVLNTNTNLGTQGEIHKILHSLGIGMAGNPLVHLAHIAVVSFENL